MADQHAGIHRGRRKAIEVLGKARLPKRQPRRARAQIVLQQFDLAGQRRCDREAAMADNLRGDALAHLAFGLGIDRQREIGMRLDVDEARRHREALGIDHPPRGAGVAADRGNAPIRNRDIARRAGIAGAVIHSAAADQDVMHGEVEGGGARTSSSRPHSSIRGRLRRAFVAMLEPLLAGRRPEQIVLKLIENVERIIRTTSATIRQAGTDLRRARWGTSKKREVAAN